MRLPGFTGALTTWKKKRLRSDDFWQQAGRYEKLLFSVAFQHTGNRFDAEDLVQEAFLAAFRSRHQLKDRHKMKPWLTVILRNAFLKRAGRSDMRPEQAYDEQVDYDYIDALAMTAAQEDALKALERKATAENLHQQLDRLPESYRSVLILYYLQEFSYQEIADMLEIPLGTVMSRLARGKQRLKTAFIRQTAQTATRKKVIPLTRKG
ncbi:MAG: sigma-70 family RNA polymerase sigma factor [Desulfobacterales bacterium]|nr:sigma-70 family RNA polymerase sigma factor [Desulfobacterales bacterium]MDJ0990944.1 sigma-70 family RNA polymerase sigma factor [Desulfobacterales bacterium]